MLSTLITVTKSFVTNWLKYNFGVFSESGVSGSYMYPKFYSNGSTVLPTSCTNEPIRWEVRIPLRHCLFNWKRKLWSKVNLRQLRKPMSSIVQWDPWSEATTLGDRFAAVTSKQSGTQSIRSQGLYALREFAAHLLGLHALATEPGFGFCQQPLEFPSGLPSKYHPGPMLTNLKK